MDRNASGAPQSPALALAVAAAVALHAGVLAGLARETPPRAVAPVPLTTRIDVASPPSAPPPTPRNRPDSPPTSTPAPSPSPPPQGPSPGVPRATAPAKGVDTEMPVATEGVADAASIPAADSGSWRSPPEPAPSERFAETASPCGAVGAHERAGAPAQAGDCSVAHRIEARPTPALLALPLQGDGAKVYAFTINGQPGEAALSFRIADGHYELTLERRAGDRELPVWRSEGRTGPQGLMPDRHTVRRNGRDRELLLFDRDRGPAGPALLAGPRAWPLPPGTQDRLSWWLQLSAMMAAEPDRRLGLVLRVPVAGAQGIHVWDFEVAAREGDRWLLRRALQRGAGRPALQWAVWLDGSRGFLPVDLRFSLDDDEQWALRLLE